MTSTTRFTLAATVAATIAIAAAADAQNLISYRPHPINPRFYEEMAASPVHPAPGVSAGASLAAARPIPPLWDGACAVDNESGVIYSTHGTATIEREIYRYLGCPPGGGALPALPIPAVIGNVTGMAVDPATKHLFLTNGVGVFEVDPMAGMVVLCAWPAAPLNVLTGLDYDPATPGIVYAVSSAGEVARYARCGGLIGVSPLSYAWPGADAVGVAMDKSPAAGGRVYVLHLNGETYDHSAGVLLSSVMPDRRGLSYLASASVVPGAGACGGATPQSRIDELAMAGQPAFAFRVCDLPVGTAAAFLLIDFALGAPVPFCASTIWLATAPIGVPVAAVGTTAVLPVGLPATAAGARLYTQWVVPCAASACGFVASHVHQIEVSR